MDDMFDQLFTFSNLIFCIVIYMLVWAQRKLIALKWSNLENNKYYRGIVLPLMPILTGAIFAALAKNYPYPAYFSTFGNRIILGCVFGLFSAHVYSMLKAFMKKAGDDSPDSGKI